MADIYDAFKPKPQTSPSNGFKQNKRMTKEEFGKFMNNKRTTLFNIANDQTMKVVNNPQSFMAFLDLQARLDYTVTNTLLVLSQNPKATLLKDYNHWNDLNAFLIKGSKGIDILEPAGEYTRKDGSIGFNYNPKTVYDVSCISNNNRFIEKQNGYSPNDLVSSIIYKTDIKPEVVSSDSTLPEDVYFDELSATVYVKEGQDPTNMINGLLREYAFVECFQQGISREDASFIANSVGYLLSKKYHLENYDSTFMKNCLSYFEGKDVITSKKELEEIKSVSKSVSERMEHGLYALQQGNQARQTERSSYER